MKKKQTTVKEIIIIDPLNVGEIIAERKASNSTIDL